MRKWNFAFSVIAILLLISFSLSLLDLEYAYVPKQANVLNHEKTFIAKGTSFDVWGITVTPKKVRSLEAQGNMGILTKGNGAIEVNQEMVDDGRDFFYKETYDNEDYITDVLGITSGALTMRNITKAILALKGGHTDNLQVELADDFTAGGKTYKKGEKIDTGLDVPKGALTPLGMPVMVKQGRIKTGITCAACHATVDRETGKVIEGAPNLNFNAGLMIALGTNSTSFFTNTDVDAERLKEYINDLTPTIKTTDGKEVSLPNPRQLEKAVDDALAKWPPGSFDSTIDLVNNPSQIPDSFTLNDHPYGWNGFASVGPFKGLSVLNNNVHAQNSDILAQADFSKDLFDLDKEFYIATILQNAPSRDYRFDPTSGKSPSEFMALIDESRHVPGVNEMVKPPNYPQISMFTPNGTVVSSPGFDFAEQINAMSAYQQSLVPPKRDITPEIQAQGRAVFERAGCISCHAGPAYTNNQMVDVDEVKTQRSRAKAFQDLYHHLGEPLIYSFDTPVPIPKDAKVLKVPTEHIDEKQKKLTFAQDENGSGGYKVKGLIGLAWSPPYLHDGGVAVGRDENKELGIPGTLHKGINPDAFNSLKALVDRDLRKKVIEANHASTDLKEANVEGIGHEYWVDEANGYTSEQQAALIEYILSLTHQ